MPFDGRLVDGPFHLNISDEGAAHIVLHPHPPKGEIEASVPFRQFFTNSSGSSDMRTDGSTNSVEYSIRAEQERDIYVASCAIIISDTGASLSQFGSNPALSNGVVFEWFTADLGTVTIDDSLKSNFDFVNLAGGNPAFGDGNTAFRANNVVGNNEAFLPFLRIQDIFGIQYGLRLRAGSNDRLSFIVRDNTTGIERFDIKAGGTKF